MQTFGYHNRYRIALCLAALIVSAESGACSLPQEGWIELNLENIFAKSTLVADAFIAAESFNPQTNSESATLEIVFAYKGTAPSPLTIELQLQSCVVRFPTQERVYVFLSHDGDATKPMTVTFMPHKRAPTDFADRLESLGRQVEASPQ